MFGFYSTLTVLHKSCSSFSFIHYCLVHESDNTTILFLVTKITDSWTLRIYVFKPVFSLCGCGVYVRAVVLELSLPFGQVSDTVAYC